MSIPAYIRKIYIGTPEQFRPFSETERIYELKGAKVCISDEGRVYIIAQRQYVDFVLGRDKGKVLDA